MALATSRRIELVQRWILSTSLVLARHSSSMHQTFLFDPQCYHQISTVTAAVAPKVHKVIFSFINASCDGLVETAGLRGLYSVDGKSHFDGMASEA